MGVQFPLIPLMNKYTDMQKSIRKALDSLYALEMSFFNDPEMGPAYVRKTDEEIIEYISDAWSALVDHVFNCLDCDKDDWSPHYMLQDDVWLEIHPDGDGILCLECAEKRMGRPFTVDEFYMGPMKSFEEWKKENQVTYLEDSELNG